MRIALAKEDIWSIRLPSRDGDVNSLHTFSKAFYMILAVYLEMGRSDVKLAATYWESLPNERRCPFSLKYCQTNQAHYEKY